MIGSCSSAIVRQIEFSATSGNSRALCLSISLVASCTSPVEITMKQELPDVEFTQRTRTFLFFALGCAVAEMMGCDAHSLL